MKIRLTFYILNILMFLFIMTNSSTAATNDLKSLNIFEQFDKQDRIMFNRLIKKAKQCISTGKLHCAEQALREARKHILSKRDSKKIKELLAKIDQEKEKMREKNNRINGNTKNIRITNIDIYHDEGYSTVCVSWEVNGEFKSNDCRLSYYLEKDTTFGTYYYVFSDPNCVRCHYYQDLNKLWCVEKGTIGHPKSLKEALELIITNCVIQ